jgi:hypothetical protein
LPEESSKPKADESEADNSLVNDESSKPKADESEAENSSVNEESSTKARRTTTTQKKIASTKTHVGLTPPILPIDSGPPVSLLS